MSEKPRDKSGNYYGGFALHRGGNPAATTNRMQALAGMNPDWMTTFTGAPKPAAASPQPVPTTVGPDAAQPRPAPMFNAFFMPFMMPMAPSTTPARNVSASAAPATQKMASTHHVPAPMKRVVHHDSWTAFDGVAVPMSAPRSNGTMDPIGSQRNVPHKESSWPQARGVDTSSLFSMNLFVRGSEDVDDSRMPQVRNTRKLDTAPASVGLKEVDSDDEEWKENLQRTIDMALRDDEHLRHSPKPARDREWAQFQLS